MFTDLVLDLVEKYACVTQHFDSFQLRVLDEHLDVLGGRSHEFVPVLAHCDMWYEHFLLSQEEQRLVGILDVSPELQDPAEDFFGLWDYGERAVDAAVAAYDDADEGLKSRSRDYWTQRHIASLFAGLTEGRPSWTAYGLSLFQAVA
jgi:hypothetical protein